eukprot:7052511-Ditylum_brightwellii.AAC.1
MRGFSVRHEEHKKKARANKQTSASNKDISKGGLMIYDKREKKLVRMINIRGQNEKEKYIEMAVYHFEFVSDLCIAACNNVSENPGFETYLGIWD